MKLSISALLLVALGGAIGAVCRYVVTLVMTRQFGDGFPWGTLTVNVVGALIIGMAFVWIDRSALSDSQRLLLVVGMLGALTTFSTFALDAYQLYQSGRVSVAAIYVLTSNTLALGAVCFGVWIAKAMATDSAG